MSNVPLDALLIVILALVAVVVVVQMVLLFRNRIVDLAPVLQAFQAL